MIRLLESRALLLGGVFAFLLSNVGISRLQAEDVSPRSDSLVAEIKGRVETMAARVEKRFAELPVESDVSRYESLVRSHSWKEVWPDEKGQPSEREVTAGVWNAAVQAALDATGSVFLPERDTPYYFDAPIVLKSGQRFVASPKAEIRLKPGVNSCLLRNERVVAFREGPVPDDLIPDTDILVEGGIWTTLNFGPGMENGNVRGHTATEGYVVGCHGVILLQNIRGVVVRDLTIRQSRAFGVHIGNGTEFLVENIKFEDHGRDGVHVMGASRFAIVRDISGTLRDDPVALNAWDWQQYAPVWGPIHHVLVEKIRGAPLEAESTDSIRLLPGVKQFPDGGTVECDLHDIVIRKVEDIRDFKLYNQPNLESGRDKDFSAGLGRAENIFLEDIVLTRPGSLQVHAEVTGLTVRDVSLNFSPDPAFRFIEIGPKSQTYKHGSDDPARWVEIFSPDLDCTVRDLSISGIRVAGSAEELPMDRVVREIIQKPNPDYPKTTPGGGTGRGIWIR
ncbi:MAG: right-handed parallel beta-helix repeat-containing protein [Verrucomicrobiae bacterium]|nr:right-handed parallel beta-helix repeat-containing protein [Verrucomicrobiae bacterium]